MMRARLLRFGYAPLLALAMGLMMLRLLAMARVLDLPGFAAFSAGMLVSNTFNMLGCLGLQAMLQREWPMDHVRGRESHACLRLAQCHWVALASALLALLAAVLAAALGALPATLPFGVVAAGVLHGVAHQVFLVASTESRSRGELMRFARQNFVRAVAALLLSVAVADATGSATAALLVDAGATALIALALLAAALRRGRLGAAAVHRLAWRRLPRVDWRIALTLTANMIVVFALLNLDRWLSAQRLAVTAFALYAFAWIGLSMAQSVQAVVNASVFPLIARRQAQHGRAAAWRTCRRASFAALAAGAVAAVPIGLALHWIVERWLPQYGAALVLLPVFLGVAVLRLADYWSGFLVIAGREASLLAGNAAVVLGVTGAWAIVVQPWSDPALSMLQVASLPAALTLVSYLVAVLLSWRARHD